MAAERTVRRYEFDWLRVSAILVVFLYHSTRFFNLGDWHVKNVDTFVEVEMWITFASTWLMPLFFIISGAGLYYAIGKSGGWRNFYTDKFMRLMVPVLVASVTHSALQVYLERVSHGQFSDSFFAFLPQYFNGLYLAIGVPLGNFAFAGMHLWYLLFLFVDSLICYRLFIWLKGSGRKALERVTTLFAMPGLICIWFSVPLLAMYAIVPPAILNAGAGAWGFAYYLWFLISGFLIVSSERLQQKIQAQRWISLLLGATLSVIFLYRTFNPESVVSPDGIGRWIHMTIYFLSAWSWLLAILGFGMRLLNFDRPWLKPANEGVLPFYIMHQTVLVGLGYFITGWEIHAVLKWAIVSTGSLMVIVTMYLFLIRKYELLRFLFGMKTTHPVFTTLEKKGFPMILQATYIGLIVLAVFAGSRSRSPMPLAYDPARDIVLDSQSITGKSPNGIDVVPDDNASIGKAIAFSSGANQRAEVQPKVYVEMRFTAPAGRYVVWLRGKSDQDGWSDSVWLQVDDQIGNSTRSLRMGNWLDIHPAGVYAWAGDSDTPIAIELRHSGEHILCIQPRQTPHRIDQIWLSRSQIRIPETNNAIGS